jgi:hypothetical protein
MLRMGYHRLMIGLRHEDMLAERGPGRHIHVLLCKRSVSPAQFVRRHCVIRTVRPWASCHDQDRHLSRNRISRDQNLALLRGLKLTRKAAKRVSPDVGHRPVTPASKVFE